MNNLDGQIKFETRGGETKVIEKRPVGRPPREVEYTSPVPAMFSFGQETTEPKALSTELVTSRQIRNDTNTLIWGIDDAEPIRILRAIADSPTATGCIGKIELYTKGSGFSDPGLMDHVINSDGETLWDLHCAIVPYLSQLDGFTVNHKYDQRGRIINAYNMATDGCRLAAHENSSKICGIKHNPYFGTIEFNDSFTEYYHVHNPAESVNEFKAEGDRYLGQVYFHGMKRTLFKHYPVPKFWSGKKWIYSDAKFATYIDKLLDNGFFESVLMKVIGDPNKMSKHPSAMRKVTGVDNIVREESYKTEGQVFNEMMASGFSGVDKAAKAMVFWSLNKDQSISLEAFPSSVNADLISGSLMETIRMISISTDVPAILANLPASLSSLSSGGDAVKNAVEYMQSNTAGRRTTLENYYNRILLPNLQKPVKQAVKILQYSPVTTSVTVEDKFWDVLTDQEKKEFVKSNVPGMQEVIKVPEVVVDETTGEPMTPEETQINDKLTNLTGKQQIQLNRISRQFDKGIITFEKAKMLLKQGFQFSDMDVNTWLGVEEPAAP